MRSFTLNGISSKDHFLTNEIRREYLPPIEVPSIKIPNRAGSVSLKRNEIGVRNIEIDVTIMASSDTDLRNRVRDLKKFLVYTEDKELIFSDEPNLKYFARFNQSSTSLEEIASMGEGTLNFTCFDPYAYSIYENTQLIAGQEDVIVNNGNSLLYPRLRISPDADVPMIKITNVTTNKMVLYNFSWLAWVSLVIDNNENRVYREDTGESRLYNLTLDSEFFPLVEGPNTLRIEQANGTFTGLDTKLRVYWTERYL